MNEFMTEKETALFLVADSSFQLLSAAALQTDQEIGRTLDQKLISDSSVLVSTCFSLFQQIITKMGIAGRRIVISTGISDKGVSIVIDPSEDEKFAHLPEMFLRSGIDDVLEAVGKQKGTSEITSALYGSLRSILQAKTETPSEFAPLFGKVTVELKKHFSFLSIFDGSGNYVSGTLTNEEDRRIATSVLRLIREKEGSLTFNSLQMDDSNFIRHKELENVVVLYFSLEKLTYCFFQVGLGVNPGILKLKLSSFLKANKELFLGQKPDRRPSQIVNEKPFRTFKITLEDLE